jgi:hypothetical protein
MLTAAPRVETLRLKDLRRHLDRGIFAVPRLQREFVWSGGKAAALLDSMLRNMPIGALVIWDARRSMRDLLRQNLNILPPYQGHNRRIWFLIDGQQRLSVIHQAFQGEQRINSRHQEVDFSRLSFVLTPGHPDGESRLFQYRHPVEGQFISVKEILSPLWRRRLAYLSARKLAKILRCRDALLTYRVPVVRIKTQRMETVRELFIRINSLGTPISAPDRAFARAAEVDLREMAHETWSTLPEGFRRVPYATILQALALVEGVKDVGERAYEAVIRRLEKEMRRSPASKRRFLRQWGRLRKALGKSADYLRARFKVLNDSYLPSSYMLALLSVFFFHKNGAPSPVQRREIAKWFWATGVGQRYSGRGFRTNIARDHDFFRRLALTGRGRFLLGERVDRAEVRRAEYTRRAAVPDAFFCLLAKRGPAYFENGEPLPEHLYTSRSNRKNKHHIFPQALLRRKAVGNRDIHSVTNVCLLDAEENQSIGSRRPSVYLALWRRRRHFRRTMRAHLIPSGPDSPLWEEHNVRRGYRRFMKQRLDEICRAFEKEAGMRLFRRD